MHGSRDGSISYTRKKSRALSTGRRGEPCTGGLGEAAFLTCVVSLMTVLAESAFILLSMIYSWLQHRFSHQNLTPWHIVFKFFVPIVITHLLVSSHSWCDRHSLCTDFIVVFAEEALRKDLPGSSQNLPSASMHAKLPSSESVLSVSIDLYLPI